MPSYLIRLEDGRTFGPLPLRWARVAAGALKSGGKAGRLVRWRGALNAPHGPEVLHRGPPGRALCGARGETTTIRRANCPACKEER